MVTAEGAARAWAEVWLETPDPFAWEGPLTYRERLTRPRVNVRGEVIPQIALVRANLRRLGKPRVRPRIPA